jgi:hypothetical protein
MTGDSQSKTQNESNRQTDRHPTAPTFPLSLMYSSSSDRLYNMKSSIKHGDATKTGAQHS